MHINREEIEKHLKEVESLDNFLTIRGVEISDLHSAMNDRVDYVPDFDYYYDFKEKQTQLAWIDTEYICPS